MASAPLLHFYSVKHDMAASPTVGHILPSKVLNSVCLVIQWGTAVPSVQAVRGGEAQVSPLWKASKVSALCSGKGGYNPNTHYPPATPLRLTRSKQIFFRNGLLCQHWWASWLENGARNVKKLMPLPHGNVLQLWGFCSSLCRFITDQRSASSLLCQTSYESWILHIQDVPRSILSKDDV